MSIAKRSNDLRTPEIPLKMKKRVSSAVDETRARRNRFKRKRVLNRENTDHDVGYVCKSRRCLTFQNQNIINTVFQINQHLFIIVII